MANEIRSPQPSNSANGQPAFDVRTTAGYRRFIEAAVRGEVRIPKAADMAAHLPAELAGEAAGRSTATSILYLAEIVVRLGVVGGLAAYALSHRLFLLLVPLLLLQAFNFYGLSAILHELAHGSFFASRRVNTVLGVVLGSLLLIRYLTFRRTHMLHHRFNQSREDPKRKTSLSDPNHRARRGARFLYERIFLPAPPIVQNVFLGTLFAVFWMPALATNQELGFLSELRARDQRIDAAIHVVFWGALLAFFAKAALVLVVVPLVLAYGLLAVVFLTHMHERMMAPMQYRFEDQELMVFNIQNLTMGRIIDRLGFHFSRYHVEHHLFPAMPFYRLPAASKFVEREYGGYILPLQRFGLDYLRRGAFPMWFDYAVWDLDGRQILSTRAFAESLEPARRDELAVGAAV